MSTLEKPGGPVADWEALEKIYNETDRPYFLNMETCETLLFQTIPLDISKDPGNQWSAIASPGRNVPFWHYTGAEDTISFNLNWYCEEENREDVLRKCKTLEAWSMNDGYISKPPRIKIMFGNMLKEATWVIERAPYKLALFQRQTGMLPHFANQEITLKKITDKNSTTADILRIDT